jgi:hypothetical protein
LEVEALAGSSSEESEAQPKTNCLVCRTTRSIGALVGTELPVDEAAEAREVGLLLNRRVILALDESGSGGRGRSPSAVCLCCEPQPGSDTVGSGFSLKRARRLPSAGCLPLMEGPPEREMAASTRSSSEECEG